MPACYDRLWKLLIDNKMKLTDLKAASGISFNVLARLGKDQPVSIDSLEKICKTLGCDIGDLMQFIEEE
jgi:DNA (cytosine-5)-methyltransferase 1